MIQTLKGDITGLDFDIIVNAANESLAQGGGVCGAIFRKAGPQLVKECAKIGHCDTGQAVITSGCDLPCKAIIHTVGPIYGVDVDPEKSLEACYWNSLALAYDYVRKNHLDHLSLAFPCISTGIYGYPHKEACAIAVKTVKRLIKEYPDAEVIDVTFVCYSEEDYLFYKKELKIR